MATYSGMGRTNTFAVKDVAKLAAELEPAGIQVLDRGDNHVTLLADPYGDGDWSSWVFDDDGDDEGHQLYIPDLIAEHLMDGETAIFEHVGNEKLRYLCGYSTAVHADGRQITISLTDMYKRAAQEFGVELDRITEATY